MTWIIEVSVFWSFLFIFYFFTFGQLSQQTLFLQSKFHTINKSQSRSGDVFGNIKLKSQGTMIDCGTQKDKIFCLPGLREIYMSDITGHNVPLKLAVSKVSECVK